MKSGIRPTRGRVNKVSKPGSSPARGGRPPQPRHTYTQAHIHEALAATAAAASSGQHDIKSDHDDIDPTAHSSVFDHSRIGAEDYAAAAAAAVAMETGLAADTHGEAEADADMEDEDPSTNTSGLGHVDLTTAANILANSGAVNTQPPPPQDHQQVQQQVDLHQSLQQAHQHQQSQQAHAHQQQPQAQMNHSMDPTIVTTTDELARQSGYTELNVESALAKRLAKEPGQRLAQQRRPEQSLNLARRSNVEALFAHIAGEQARVPCKNCHKGHGPWTSCVIVDGQMCGSCANCWFNASGARCSFHETRNPQANSNIMQAAAGGVPADAAYRGFAGPHGLMPGAPNPVMGGIHAGLMTANPVLQHMVNKAMADVRQADKATRQLILIDITAKQLALQIAEYEEMTSNQDNTGQGPGQQIMGDDGGA
ncbi:Protein of unknown function (DUF3716) domain containing protein [Naviculisporaceae sp. PSN 640]